MDLVGCVGIPDDQLSILRGGDQMTAIGRPVHSVNLGQVALERATGLHSNSGEGIGLVGCDLADCKQVSVYSFKFELHRALCQSECPRVCIPKGVDEGVRVWEGDPRAKGSRTGSVGQLILPALDLVLQPLSLTSGRSNFGLHLFTRHIG